MKYLLATLFLFLLSGCFSSTVDKTEAIKKEQTLDFKTASSDKGSNSYSGDPVDHIVVTASGCAQINLNVGDKGKVQKGEKRDTSDKEELEESFSVDYYLRAIPTMGWAFLGLVGIGLMITYILFSKITKAGAAIDGASAGAINMVTDSTNHVRKMLSEATKGTEHHTYLMNELDRPHEAKEKGKEEAERAKENLKFWGPKI